jgi:hypothetical protein
MKVSNAVVLFVFLTLTFAIFKLKPKKLSSAIARCPNGVPVFFLVLNLEENRERYSVIQSSLDYLGASYVTDRLKKTVCQETHRGVS